MKFVKRARGFSPVEETQNLSASLEADIAPVLFFLMSFLEEQNANDNPYDKNHRTDDIRKQEWVNLKQFSVSEQIWVVLARVGKSSSDQRPQDGSSKVQSGSDFRAVGEVTYPNDHTNGMIAYAEATQGQFRSTCGKTSLTLMFLVSNDFGDSGLQDSYVPASPGQRTVPATARISCVQGPIPTH